MEHGVVAPDKTSVQNAKDSVDSLFNLIVDSETFRGAPVMRGLLLYLWRHQGESINEYAIAVDALGRPPDFDPKGDATVRVGIARLRTKLKEFYERETESTPLQLTIPLGGHEIRWIQPSQPPSRLSTIRVLPLFYRNILLGSITVGTVLAVLSIVLVLENRTLRASLPTPVHQLPRFWRSFLVGGKGPIIVVPSPLFLRWSTNGGVGAVGAVVIRDVEVSQFQDWMTSPIARQVAEKWGPPTLAQAYISVRAAKSAARIMQYLDRLGQHPELTDSPNLAADAASAQNTIFLGSLHQYAEVERVKQILDRTNFYVRGSEPTVVVNRNPAPGEVSEYREVDFSVEHKVVPAVVSLLPVTSNGTRTLLLLGANSAILTSILITSDGLKLLDEQWRKAGFPDSWEMVIQAETNGETVLRFQALAIRSVAASFWK